MSQQWLCLLPSEELRTNLSRGWREVRDAAMLRRLDAFPRPIRLLRLRHDTSQGGHDLLRDLRQRPLIALRAEGLTVRSNTDCEHIVASLNADNLYPWQAFVANLCFRLHPLFEDPPDRVWKPQIMLACSGKSGSLDPTWRHTIEPVIWHPRSFAIVEATLTGHRYVDVFHV